ncbi:pilus assembly PilX family protein [Collimonas fungivorans]|uniref:pilus assembly PilX family protein n=1 Tax=Collimonas fungivorans TaxID=158899 RepID=UPI003FA3BFD3
MFALIILMISGIALVRSFDSSLVLAGNMAFKRDLVNQGERGMSAAILSMKGAGALVSETTRQSDLPSSNYSASLLATDAHGIPVILLKDSAWTTAGMSASDITDAVSQVTIRYVIDRLCSAPGAASPASCIVSSYGDKGGTADVKRATGVTPPVYRISVRVTGPRSTQTYLQTTFSL